MKPQKPAEGILMSNDFGNTKTYIVTCDCCRSDCVHNVWVESDGSGTVSVTIYNKLKTRWWESSRWTLAWRLLTQGYLEYEADIMMSEQQALNYADTLKSAIKDVKKFKRGSRG
jgi:hypothetical protein